MKGKVRKIKGKHEEWEKKIEEEKANKRVEEHENQNLKRKGEDGEGREGKKVLKDEHKANTKRKEMKKKKRWSTKRMGRK